MNIKTIIEGIVAGLPTPGKFLYGWKSFQNFKADEEALFPLRYLDYPLVGKDKLYDSGLIETSFTITLGFFNKVKTGSNPEQHDIIVQQQRSQSAQFLTACQASSDIHFVKDSKRTEMVNIFDINLSGIVLEVTLVPFNSDSVCL